MSPHEERQITLTISLGDITDLYRYGPLFPGHVLLSDAWEAAGGYALVSDEVRREHDKRSAA